MKILAKVLVGSRLHGLDTPESDYDYRGIHISSLQDIKREIFENYIRDYYNIQFVLDDRNQVVEMWRSLGLKCLQVQEGDF